MNLCHMNRKRMDLSLQKFSDDEQLSCHELDILNNTHDDYIQSPEGTDNVDTQKSEEGSKEGRCQVELLDDVCQSIMSNEEETSHREDHTSSATEAR